MTHVACTKHDADCTCNVENNGEARTLVCGETRCVGGTTLTCGEKDKGIRGGPCNGSVEPPDPDAGAPGGEPTPEPDHSCDDLLSFCNSSCSNPPSVSADCQATASAGDPQACSVWQFANGVACRP